MTERKQMTQEELKEAWYKRLRDAGVLPPPAKPVRNYPGRGCGTVDLTPRYRKSVYAPWGQQEGKQMSDEHDAIQEEFCNTLLKYIHPFEPPEQYKKMQEDIKRGKKWREVEFHELPNLM